MNKEDNCEWAEMAYQLSKKVGLVLVMECKEYDIENYESEIGDNNKYLAHLDKLHAFGIEMTLYDTAPYLVGRYDELSLKAARDIFKRWCLQKAEGEKL